MLWDRRDPGDHTARARRSRHSRRSRRLHQHVAEGADTFEPTYLPTKGPARPNMSSATHIKLRAKVEAWEAEHAAQAHAAQVEQERLARTEGAEGDAPTPGQGNEAPRPDLVNPFEPLGLDEAPTPECRTVPLVPPLFAPPIHGGALEVETQEDHDRLDNDLLAQPAIPTSTRSYSRRRGIKR